MQLNDTIVKAKTYIGEIRKENEIKRLEIKINNPSTKMLDIYLVAAGERKGVKNKKLIINHRLPYLWRHVHYHVKENMMAHLETRRT